MSGFIQATTPQVQGDLAQLDYPETSATFGVNGGFLAASVLRAGAAMANRARPLSIACSFPRPVRPGPASVRGQALSAGRRATLISAELEQSDKLCVAAQVWFGDASEGLSHTSPAPSAPQPESLPTLQQQMGAAAASLEPFWRQFDQRPVPPAAEAGAPRARALRWIRYVEPIDQSDVRVNAASLLPLIDTLGLTAYRQAYGREAVAGPTPTLQLAVQFYDLSPAGPWRLCESFAEFAAEGQLSTRVRVWTDQGLLAAQGMAQMLLERGRDRP